MRPDELPLAVSALMVGLDMIHIHKHTKSWALEIVLITDGGSRPFPSAASRATDEGEHRLTGYTIK